MNTGSATCCRRYLVRGQVQGVFYRASAQRAALDLGLTGWVRNLSDGSVEALACGPAAALDAFEAWLWQGPPRARVSAVEVVPRASETHAGFAVRG